MKHWDLRPNEIVTLRRGDGAAGKEISAVFRFRTTLLACFETSSGRMLEFEAREDGTLSEVRRDSFMRDKWHIVGEDRQTRFVARETLGQRRHLTIGSQRGLARAAKGGVL